MGADLVHNAPLVDGTRCYRRGYRVTDCALLLSATAIVCLLGITNDSLWMDEGWSVWAASSSSVGSLVHDTMLNCRDAIAQMPFYSFYLWAWAHIFGMGEVALRLSNGPLVLLLLFAMQAGSIVLFGRRAGWMIGAASPFLWFYVNEVRPYVAVMAFAAVASVSLLLYVDSPGSRRQWAPWLCLSSSFLLCGVNMLGVFLIPALIAGLVLSNGSRWEKWREALRDWSWPAIVFFPLFLCLGSYYAWTLWQDTHGVRGIPGIRNLALAGYEFTGFLGLGPPRNVLREAPVGNALKYVGTLAVGLAGWLVVMICAFTQSKADGVSRRVVLLCEMFGTGVFLHCIAAVMGRHSFWGRHLAELFPLFILILVGLLAGDSVKGGRSCSRRIATACLIVIWLLSAMRLAFLEEYKKDDYRGAVSCVVNAAGETGTILWAASIPAASYYGLWFDEVREQIHRPSARVAEYARNWSEEQLEAAFREGADPFIVAVSRADLSDPENVIEKWVTKRGGQLIALPSAFRIYNVSRRESHVKSSTKTVRCQGHLCISTWQVGLAPSDLLQPDCADFGGVSQVRSALMISQLHNSGASGEFWRGHQLGQGLMVCVLMGVAGSGQERAPI